MINIGMDITAAQIESKAGLHTVIIESEEVLSRWQRLIADFLEYLPPEFYTISGS